MRRKLGVVCSCILLASLIAGPTAEAAPSSASLQSEIDRLETQISTLDEDYLEARLELSQAEQQIRELEVAKKEADEQLSGLRETASQRAAAAYRMGVPNILLILFGSENISDFNRRMGAASRIGDWESGVMTDLQIANRRAETRAEELRAERDRASKLAESIDAKRDSLASQVAEHESAMSRLAARHGTTVSQLRRDPVIAAPPLPAEGRVSAVLAAAYAKIGTPYRWGGSGPGSFDCSGFTSHAWRAGGVSLPHSSRAQYAVTKRVSRANLRPGDLVFFGSPIHHVGLYVGGGNMIDASTYGRPVAVRTINRRGYVGAGRPGV